MNKFSFIAIAIAILLGVVVGSIFTSHKAEKELEKLRHDQEKKLEHKSDSLLEVIHSRDKLLLELDRQIKDDSVRIQGMLYKIQQDGVRTEQKRAEAKKFTSDEKASWLNKRYSH